jgi:nitroreductase
MNLDYIYKRRSIRKFKPDEVPDGLITEMLKAAMAAPSGKNRQPWEFIVVKNAQARTEITKHHPNAQMAKDSPLVIIVLGKKAEKWHIHDCAAATENILIAAANLGLGAVWCGMDEEKQAGIKKIFNVPDEYWVFSIIPIGYPNEEKPPRTQYTEDKVHLEAFGRRQ